MQCQHSIASGRDFLWSPVQCLWSSRVIASLGYQSVVEHLNPISQKFHSHEGGTVRVRLTVQVDQRLIVTIRLHLCN